MTSPRPEDALAREANVIARYLLDMDCPPELAARYADAVLRLAPDSQRPTAGSRVAAFALRNPALLPYIASAAPLLAAGAHLRWKLTAMAAILETTPRFAREFLPRDLSLAQLLATLAVSSIVSGLRALVGVPLLVAARFSR